MTLVKTRSKITANQKKMTAAHHRKTQHYLKPYWPYLPIILILGGALFANELLPASFSNSPLTQLNNGARIDSVIGNHSSLLIIVLTVLLIFLVGLFLIRHIKILRNLIVHGEEILSRKLMLDIVLALVIAGLFIMLN